MATESNIKIQMGVDGFVCQIECPICLKWSKPPPYWTKNGIRFNLYNFNRHYMGQHGASAGTSAENLAGTSIENSASSSNNIGLVLNELAILKGELASKL